MKPALLLLPLSFAPASFLGQDAQAGQVAQLKVAELTAAELTALKEITLARVRKTIRFLAADELKGRDTSSPGLHKASEYVAQRFKAAGLEGLGPDGSFFLAATVKVPPQLGFQLKGSEGEIKCHGLLAAGAKPLRYAGKISSEVVKGRPLFFPNPDSRNERSAIMTTVRRASRAARKGATALLVQTEQVSRLALAAKKLDTEEGRGLIGLVSRSRIPILLVPGWVQPGTFIVDIPQAVEAPDDNRNVCGVLPGSDAKLSKEAVLITAHLDHIGTRTSRRGGSEKDTINNGADDDASGCTGVMSLADAFGALKTRPKRSVIFMTFWGEERGLLGSKHFCAHPAWPLEKIVANVNLEMLGRPEEGAQHKAWMTGWTKSDLGELMALGAARVGVEVFRHRRFSPMLYGSSDNASFVRAGVIAHSFSAGSLHEDYHKPGDEWEKLDLPHMTKVIQGMFTGCLPFAHGKLTPRKK